MNINSINDSNISGIKIIELNKFCDNRGYFAETYRSTDFSNNHLNFFPKGILQSNESFSKKNVLRGLHYDDKTYKLVQALAGEIYLVVLDVREGSDTFGKWESYIISEKTRDQVLVPPGFANGHYALTDCIFHYNLFYSGGYVDENKQGVIKWNDPKFNIEWPTVTPTLQQRDR